MTNSVKNDHSRFLAIMNSLGDSALSHNPTHRLGCDARVSENYLRETFHSAMTNSVKTLAQDSSGRRRLSTRWKQSPREPSFTIPRDDDFTDRLCPTSQPHTPPRISGNYDRRLPMSVCGHRTPQSSHCARDTTSVAALISRNALINAKSLWPWVLGLRFLGKNCKPRTSIPR